jgi:hypothetical protein
MHTYIHEEHIYIDIICTDHTIYIQIIPTDLMYKAYVHIYTHIYTHI